MNVTWLLTDLVQIICVGRLSFAPVVHLAFHLPKEMKGCRRYGALDTSVNPVKWTMVMLSNTVTHACKYIRYVYTCTYIYIVYIHT